MDVGANPEVKAQRALIAILAILKCSTCIPDVVVEELTSGGSAL